MFIAVYIWAMFIAVSQPPPEPQRITAVEPARLCPRLDLTCRIEHVNDVLEGVARLLDSSARSDSGNTYLASGTDGVRVGDRATATVTSPAPSLSSSR
jgi:hypothetical protein